MRGPALASAILMLLGACNAILGNESDYRLDPDLSVGGEPSSGGSTSGSGGSSGNQTSGGSSAGKAAEGGSGAVGEAGGGGEPQCDPTSAEDCFNGVDDDCNGDVDCEDAACAEPAECVPVPGDAQLGTFLAAGESCPAGTSAVELHQGLTADPLCTGCSCLPAVSYCDSSIVGLTCGQGVLGNSYNVFSDRCSNVSPANGGSVRFYNVLGFSDCTPQGTATPSAVSWAQSNTFCKVDRMGLGCDAGSRCVAKAAEPACTIQSGERSCGGAYPRSTGDPWSTDYVDERECGECLCAFQFSACLGGAIQVYSQPNCQGTMVTLGSAGQQGDNCNVGFTPASGRVTGTPASNDCEPNTYAHGELQPQDSSTICCR